ncbi:MAG TPA: class I SAM-dependent methyltransferase [Ktedonobacterales bacterium]|jgi:ubiquinone/menaquinone biosynthesis C-methylase UbiE
MATPQTPALDFSAIKTRQQKVWSTGNYSLVGNTLVIISEQLSESVDVHAGDRVLDVATGNGITALAAARRFGEVTGLDYVPSLLDDARQRAAAEHLPVTFQEGDAENIPFADASFDIVLSTLGVMFTPNQDKAASELLRVARSGGKIGVASWTPTGYIGQLFRLIGKYAPPPAGLKPASLWGTEERLRELFGDGITALQTTKRHFVFRYRSAAHWVEYFAAYYGPFLTTFNALDAAKRDEFSHEVTSLLDSLNQAKDGTLVVPAEYLEAVAIRR